MKDLKAVFKKNDEKKRLYYKSDKVVLLYKIRF